MQTVTFNGALEAIESLSIDDQAALLEIIQRRLIEHRRAEIARNIVQAKAAHQAGTVFRGAVEDAIAELNR